MNSLNSLGNRQIASLNADLAKMESGEAGPSVQGQITTTLGALNRLIDDYDSMARKEMVTAAREKANTRVAKLKEEHKNLKLRFEQAKSEGQQRKRDELFSSTSSTSHYSSASGSATQRKATNPNAPPSPIHESPFATNASTHSYTGPSAREDFALREHTFLQESENSIDQYIAQGRSVLENLVEQRGMLKGTRRKLLDAANTLGLSRETIGWVERRTKQDAWIFGVGATFTLFSFWVIWHYLG
ncbi:snare region anchored in the vesicle membrane C-terminus-domain-containing protein [Kockovaella imperatae]|uniref:Protein transport protein BOS1 n=1 Tax=Kockovaella imperatae TaxID=4999 RepID=A0A1Y1UGG9_9TREE|nr:snare region anchored in the vesicle membrane C-terminus-domain-containing protein [Kockovaella imperatae]ORX36604.1 snare region anchored in the vesicle membrane C-terminus-domain-containing protein [Kockovaella imperatae]